MIPMDNPATASWGLSISDSDFEKLKRGLLARDMDDKWAFLAMTDEELLQEAAEEETTKGEEAKENTTDSVLPDEELTEEELFERQVRALEEIEREELEEEQRAADREAAVNLDEGGNISIRRAWSNKELYRLVVKPRSRADGGVSTAKIESITWAQNQGDHVSEEQAKIDAVLLCRSQLECEISAAADYDPLLYSGFPRSWATHGIPTAQNGTNDSSQRCEQEQSS